MTRNNQYTTALALSLTRHHTYQRGKEYYLAGKVEIVANDKKGVSAIVDGTDEYKVVLWFDRDNEFHYRCSCPVDNDRDGACKHVVACVLTLAEKDEENAQIVDKNGIKKEQLPEMTNTQARQFIEIMIEHDPKILDELKVFVQGKVETKTTTDDYFEKYRLELAKINLDKLLESWYEYNEMGEWDDGYYGDSMEVGDSDNQLSLWVDEVVELIQRYSEQENYGETLKIGIAATRALVMRQSELKEGMSDLDDWFASGIYQLIQNIAKLNNLLSHEQLLLAKEQWKLLLSTKGLEDYLGLMVESVATVLLRLKEYEALEKHVERYLLRYPPVALTLMSHYSKNSENERLLRLAERVMEASKKTNYDQYFDLNNYYDKKDLIVKVRRMMAQVFVKSSDKQQMVNNLEELFLTSRKIEDYKELRDEYKNREEKEIFWQRMEKEFGGSFHIENLFLVYKLEGEKERILQLIEKYRDQECFAKMVREVRDKYPKECYEEYKTKMKALLIPTDTSRYDGVAYHLKQMQEIGLDDQFVPYLESIKTEYKRRRRMMEAIAKRGL